MLDDETGDEQIAEQLINSLDPGLNFEPEQALRAVFENLDDRAPSDAVLLGKLTARSASSVVAHQCVQLRLGETHAHLARQNLAARQPPGDFPDDTR